MAMIYEVATGWPIGMVCDSCGKEDPNCFNDFVVRHTFGYDSRLDGSTVEAALCDNCLEVLLKQVPGAQWISGG